MREKRVLQWRCTREYPTVVLLKQLNNVINIGIERIASA